MLQSIMFKKMIKFFRFIVEKYRKYCSRNNVEAPVEESVPSDVGHKNDVTIEIKHVHSHYNPDFIDLNVLDNMFNSDKELTLKGLPAFKKEPKEALISKSSKWTKNIELNGLDFIYLFIKDGEHNLYSPSTIKKNHVFVSLDLIINCDNYLYCAVCNIRIFADSYILIEHIFSEEHIKYLSLIHNNHIEKYNSLKISYQIWFAKNYISIEKNERSYCHACQFRLDTNLIQIHLLDRNHIDKYDDMQTKLVDFQPKFIAFLEDVWYYTQFFKCTVCHKEVHTEIEFLEHLKNENHINKVNKYIARICEMEFQTCFACVTGIFGVREKYYEHCRNIFHERYLKKGDYNVPEMRPPSIDLLNRTEDKKRRLIDESNLVILENREEKKVLKDVETVVQSVYPNAKAYRFGSRCSQTALSNSDLDIFLDCNNTYYKNFKTALSRKYLSKVRKCFENYKDEWYIEEVLVDARIPIIKLRHYPTDLKCDISFSNGLAHRKSKLVRYYNDAYPMCRELILYVKKWVTYSQLSGPEGISTFTLSWLVIFYLQRIGVFPSVYELIKCQTRSIIIDGWECGYQKNICIKSNNSNFVEHLVGLFTFYAKFDYQKNVICPYLGLVIEKERFATGELPSKLTPLLSNRKKEAVSLFRFDSPMCMQDPTELSQNSTKALRKRQLRCFREYCSSSVERIISGLQDACL